MRPLPFICTLVAWLGVVRADAGFWASPLCFVVPGIDNEHCDAFLGMGFGTCASGYEATWFGTCEREHDDSHDHFDLTDTDATDHTHFTDFEHGSDD